MREGGHYSLFFVRYMYVTIAMRHKEVKVPKE